MKIKLPEYRSDAIEKSIDCSAEVNKVSLYSPECMLTPADELDDELGFPESVDELDESEDGLGNDREMEFSNSEDFRCGEDPEKEADGRTAPLMVAAASNNVAAVKILLEEGANPNHKNKAGWSATMLACQQDTEYEKMVHMLVDAGGSVSAVSPLGQRPVVLYFATYCGDLTLLQTFLSNNSSNRIAEIALNRAAFFGHLNMVLELLKRPQMNINAPDSSGFTTFDVAAYKNNLRIMFELLKYPNIESMDFNLCDKRIEIVRKLKQYPKIDINSTNSEGCTILIATAYLGEFRSLKELLNHPKLDVNQTMPGDVTPLKAALRGLEAERDVEQRRRGYCSGEDELDSLEEQGNVAQVMLVHPDDADWWNEVARIQADLEAAH
ncbi:putative Ankyrin-1 [Nannochloris sp. 'desiccata']|nr:putative Ankyrin-1 [Chlorella desiccata (nom. nud.)]